MFINKGNVEDKEVTSLLIHVKAEASALMLVKAAEKALAKLHGLMKTVLTKTMTAKVLSPLHIGH